MGGMSSPSGVAAALRTARNARGLSLTEVASSAGISTATLSRIETEKQSVDVSLLLTLSRILHVSAAELVGGRDEQENDDELVATFAAMSIARRARILTASAARRPQKQNAAQLQTQVDALLDAIDLLRDELAHIQKQMRRRR